MVSLQGLICQKTGAPETLGIRTSLTEYLVYPLWEVSCVFAWGDKVRSTLWVGRFSAEKTEPLPLERTSHYNIRSGSVPSRHVHILQFDTEFHEKPKASY